MKIKPLLLAMVIMALGAVTPAGAFVHPGIPLTKSDLDTVKANLNTEPWKSAYAALTADSHSQLTYTMQGPFASVSRTPDVNLSQYKNDMQAIYNLSRMWYFTGNTAYAQKAHDIILAWATTQTSFGGAEAYLSMGDYAYRVFGGTDILRGTWPGWTPTDTDTCKVYFNTVYWAQNWIAVPYPVRSANQGVEQLVTAMGVAVFNDDMTKFTQCLQSFRADTCGGLADSLPNGEVGDSGRDQGHAYGELMHLAWIAEVAWKQGVDLYAEDDNRLLATGEFFSRYNLGVNTPWMPFGTKYDYFWSGHGGAPNSSPQPPDFLDIIQGAYVTRKGMSAPYLGQYLATRPENSDSFVFRKSVDSSTATPPAPLTAPAPTAPLTSGFLDADIGTATPAGSGTYSNGIWTVTGAGTDTWTTPDSNHYTYKQVTGDFTMIARLTDMVNNSGSASAKAGLIMRDSLSAGSTRRIYFGYIPNGAKPMVESYQIGWTANSHNDPDESTHDGPMPPVWLKIQRIGSRISVFHSPDGGSWVPLQNAEYAGWTGTAYVGLSVCSRVNGTLNTATFTNVRITGGDNGEAVTPPLAPFQVYASPGDRQVPLRWLESFGATRYNVKRATSSDGPYSIIANVSGTSFVDATASNGTAYYYVVSAVNSAGESDNSPEDSVTPQAPLQKLTGTVIGSSGSWGNNSATTKLAALDGDFATFYDAAQSSGAWVGVDLGTPQVIAQVRYVPRTGQETRMVDGLFQASNTPDFSSGTVTLASISNVPPDNVYTSQNVSEPAAYRYVRYFGPGGGLCNVAEIGFYKVPATTKISGKVMLQGYGASSQAQPLTFTLTPPGEATTSQVMMSSTAGAFTLTDIPAGMYTLGIKGSKWLRQIVRVDTGGGDVSGVSAILLTGDVNNDNQVSAQDLGLLRKAYGSTPASPNWDARADLNGDNQVSAQDLGLLRSNYGKAGN